MSDPMYNSSTRAIEAMELALATVDVSDAQPHLDALTTTGLAPAKRSEIIRKTLAAAKLTWANGRAAKMLALAECDLPLPVGSIWPFAAAETLFGDLPCEAGDRTHMRSEVRLRDLTGTDLHVACTSWWDPDVGPWILRIGLVDVGPHVKALESLRQIQSEMAHADRLSTLGVMTATVAHEVRQPLAAIVTSSEAALRWLQRPEPDLEQVGLCLGTIALGARQANTTVARLHAMSSSRAGARQSTLLRPLIEETVTFVQQELTSRQTTVELDVPEGLPPIHVDPVQIRQVLANLLINAAQAMADAQCWSRALKIRVRPDAVDLIVDVEDNGPGVPEADRGRLFDGFFTTKPGGLGLGLRICRAIIEGHGGTLDHVSKGSRGSIFRFRLATET